MDKTKYPNSLQLQNIALWAGKIIVKDFRKRKKQEIKADGSIVTKTDKRINAEVIKYVKKNFPHITVLGEEQKHIVSSSEYIIVCDPLDGTQAFARGLAISTFCISVIYRCEVIAAVIYDPFEQRMWRADKGKGTTLTDMRTGRSRKVHVSKHAKIKGSSGALLWWKKELYNIPAVFNKLINRNAKWTRLPCTAIFGGLIASGNFDAALFPVSKGYEAAAMQLLIEEAGGKATDMFGKKLRYDFSLKISGLIVSNGFLHSKIVRLVATCKNK